MSLAALRMHSICIVTVTNSTAGRLRARSILHATCYVQPQPRNQIEQNLHFIFPHLVRHVEDIAVVGDSSHEVVCRRRRILECALPSSAPFAVVRS